VISREPYGTEKPIGAGVGRGVAVGNGVEVGLLVGGMGVEVRVGKGEVGVGGGPIPAQAKEAISNNSTAKVIGTKFLVFIPSSVWN